MLARVDALDADLADLDAKLAELIAPFAVAVERLDEIPGLGQLAARLLLAELGVDMTRFPTAGHLVSWAKFAPGVSESAGNARAAGRPGVATRTWLVCSARPPWPPARPIPSLGHATGGSLADAARGAPSSRSAGPSWSLSGTCWPTQKPTSTTWAPASTTPASVLNAPSATTPPAGGPGLQGHPRTRRLTRPAPGNRHRANRIRGPPGCCRTPTPRGFWDQVEVRGSSPARPTKPAVTSGNAGHYAFTGQPHRMHSVGDEV